MVDTLSIVLMGAALAGGVLRAFINGSLTKKQTLGDIIITGAAGGSFPMLGVIPKDLTLFHAGLMMFGVAYVASDALQRLYTGMVDRFAGPLIPPAPKTVLLLPAVLPFVRSAWGMAWLLGLLLILAGCASGARYPGYVKCLGKGTVTGSAQQSLSAGVGGAGQNTFSLIVDCPPPGLQFEQGKAGLEVSPTPAK